jgi:para-aminobenzoate synthetase component 1
VDLTSRSGDSRTLPAAEPGRAWFAGVEAVGVVEHVDVNEEPDRLAAGGFWAVVGEFEGSVSAWRFADVRRGPATGSRLTARWRGPHPGSWRSSLDRTAYRAGVEAIRERIRAGDVYQVNLCRVLSTELAGPGGSEPDPLALAQVLAAGNPAPFAGGVHVPLHAGFPPAWVVTASPELFVRVAGGRICSGPIKGTAAAADGMTRKDEAENIMITDMVRNDLQRVCLPGTVEVTSLLELEHHPGLAHLVSTVEGELDGPVDWAAILAATYPPASVSGAPKHTALQAITALEPVARGPYCGMVGWVDADTGRAELAVGIRTFWWTGPGGADEAAALHFGTGAGITWDSDADAEWAETELKAGRLIALASGTRREIRRRG